MSRAACDLHLQSFHEAYGFPVVFTRAANVYGPGQQLYRIIPRGIAERKNGENDGASWWRSVGDPLSTSGMWCTSNYETGAGGRTRQHVAPIHPKYCSIRELVEKICAVTGCRLRQLIQSSEDRLGKDQSYLLESSSMRQVHDWSDEVSLEEATGDTGMGGCPSSYAQSNAWSYQHKT